MYTKKRSEFGRQPLLSDSHAQLHVNIEPDDSLQENFIEKDPVDMVVQFAPEMTEHEVIATFVHPPAEVIDLNVVS